jgi:hypothetical protein
VVNSRLRFARNFIFNRKIIGHEFPAISKWHNVGQFKRNDEIKQFIKITEIKELNISLNSFTDDKSTKIHTQFVDHLTNYENGNYLKI